MTFADKVSAVRIILIPAFVSLLIYSRHNASVKYFAVGVFILAILSDFFDGLVARIKKEKSELGQIIDPLADKTLLLTAFISLYLLKFSIPLWVVLVVVSREFLIILGVIVLYLLKVEVVIYPSIWGKLTTFFQMFTILCVLLDCEISHIYISPFIWSTAVIFTVISGTHYFLRGVKTFNVKTGVSSRI